MKPQALYQHDDIQFVIGVSRRPDAAETHCLHDHHIHSAGEARETQEATSGQARRRTHDSPALSVSRVLYRWV